MDGIPREVATYYGKEEKSKPIAISRIVTTMPALKSLSMQDFLLESYRYPLDEKRIALMPASPSESAKMFVYSRDSGQRWHESFGDLPGHIGENDVLFLNDSKVLPARIVTDRCTIVRPSGKTDIRTVELLYLRSTDDKTFETMVYPGDYFPV